MATELVASKVLDSEVHIPNTLGRPTQGRTMEHCLKIAAVNRKVSPLLRLPPEIRNLIYSFTFGGQQLLCSALYTPRKTTETPKFLALLSVSRQIYLETRLLPFKLCTFRFLGGWDYMETFAKSLLREQRESIGKIQLESHENDEDYQYINLWDPLDWFLDFQVDKVYTEITNLFPGLQIQCLQRHLVWNDSTHVEEEDLQFIWEVPYWIESTFPNAPFITICDVCFCYDSRKYKKQNRDHYEMMRSYGVREEDLKELQTFFPSACDRHKAEELPVPECNESELTWEELSGLSW